VLQWRARDPIAQLQDRLTRTGLLDEAGRKAIEDEVQQQVEDAIRFAEESADPPLDSLYENVFA
jgi:pyruvate dehydrogenase E1 component alpha subunit